MIEISFLDGKKKSFSSKVSVLEVAKGISPSLAKRSIAASVNGELKDLSHVINENSNLEFITTDNIEIYREIIRHDAAHILAQAVKSLFPNAQVTIGPAIENGFYYDFADVDPFSTDDLVQIEDEMQRITAQKLEFIREEWSREKAIEYFLSIGEKYKVDIIQSIDNSEKLTIYKQGDFLDLCRGPHCSHTGMIKHYKLLKVAGAYWRGDSNNQMLQRIYGTAWESKDALELYLHRLEEAALRDHRKLGKELDLFHIQNEAVGSIFWHKNGYFIFRTIEEYIREKLILHNYQEVKTPLLIDRSLWEKSGHWDKFRENMFIAESEDRTLVVKPMNCPAHIEIFNHKLHSYRDLPLRISEFGCCHRNESSGSLHGLMRVRSFTQDDAHIFCTNDQILEETKNFISLLLEVYKDFGFLDVRIKFSDRPEKRVGSDQIWDEAELALKNAVDIIGLEYSLNKGEGAFYGPKLEFVLVDAIGRDWQCGTLQLDFVLPERLGASYIDEHNSKKVPIMIHRAILGSLERFIGVLIEEYKGIFPIWLAPTITLIAPINDAVVDYAKDILRELESYGIRSEIDISNERLNYKVRNASLKKIPYIIVIGEKEKVNQTITIREFGQNDQQTLSLEGFVIKINNKIEQKSLDYKLD